MPEQQPCKDPHDKGYKDLLSYKEIFFELLDSFVDQGWVSQIDREQELVRIDKEFVSPEFKEQEADLVYQLKFKGEDVIFYLLMELQSKVDFQMPYRLLQYMMGVWEEKLKNTGDNEKKQKRFKLPVIVPIVLYNGKLKWTAKRSFKETLAKSKLFGEYVVDFKYI
ncbi:MAG TPA: Rpn family recombination-promoting nuclease/putative transposase [Bacillota bacterium]|nr:Rpn family recombination-promoting nuclease/putative transposase [Bacillota bacterium]